VWNSLEIVKLLVAGLVPLTVVGLGVWVTKLTNRLESAQWINQKLVEKRIKLVDDLALDLNDLYCYFLFIGVWKALSPVDVIDRKRRLDRIVYVNRPFLGETCSTTYDAFIKLLFKTFRDPGQDAGLRTTLVSADVIVLRTIPA
jgi:hypothetical protein